MGSRPSSRGLIPLAVLPLLLVVAPRRQWRHRPVPVRLRARRGGAPGAPPREAPVLARACAPSSGPRPSTSSRRSSPSSTTPTPPTPSSGRTPGCWSRARSSSAGRSGANGHGRDRHTPARRHHRHAGRHHRRRGARPRSPQGDFSPVYPTFPYAMHKNFAGTRVRHRGRHGLRPSDVGRASTGRWSLVLMTLMLVAVLFTQSRQAVIGLVAAVFVLVLRSETRPRRRSKLRPAPVRDRSCSS